MEGTYSKHRGLAGRGVLEWSTGPHTDPARYSGSVGARLPVDGTTPEVVGQMTRKHLERGRDRGPTLCSAAIKVLEKESQ